MSISSRKAHRDFSHTENQLPSNVDRKHLIQCATTESIAGNWDRTKRRTVETGWQRTNMRGRQRRSCSRTRGGGGWGLAEKACSKCLTTTQISYRRNHFIRVCVQIKLLLFVVVVVQQLGFTASICRAERFLTLPRCSNQTYGCQCSGR